MAAESAGIGLLILLEMVELWQVLLLTFLGGSLRAIVSTARQSFTYDLVGPANAVRGLALVGLFTRIGGLAGSLMTGSITGWLGVEGAYLFAAGSYVVAGAIILAIHSPVQASPQITHSAWEDLKGYLQEVRRNQVLLPLTVSTAAAEILGFSYQVILPTLARDVLHIGAEGLGVLNAFRSVGGMLGSALLSLLGRLPLKGAMYLLVLHLFGGSVVSLGFVPNVPLAILTVTVISILSVMVDTLSQGLMQLSVPDKLRGRAAGSWTLAIGLGPLGYLQVGGLVSLAGMTLALTANGLILVALAAGGTLLVPRLRRL